LALDFSPPGNRKEEHHGQRSAAQHKGEKKAQGGQEQETQTPALRRQDTDDGDVRRGDVRQEVGTIEVGKARPPGRAFRLSEAGLLPGLLQEHDLADVSADDAVEVRAAGVALVEEITSLHFDLIESGGRWVAVDISKYIQAV
jgi:hypothetical protein